MRVAFSLIIVIIIIMQSNVWPAARMRGIYIRGQGAVSTFATAARRRRTRAQEAQEAQEANWHLECCCGWNNNLSWNNNLERCRRRRPLLAACRALLCAPPAPRAVAAENPLPAVQQQQLSLSYYYLLWVTD